MGADLLPCPFCGGRANIVKDRTQWLVFCTTEDCDGRARKSTTEQAIAAWNRRAPPLAAPAPSAMATGDDEARAWDHAEDAIEADDDAMEAAIDAFELTPPIEGDERGRTFRRRQLRRAFRALIEAHPRATPPAAPAAVTEAAAALLAQVKRDVAYPEQTRGMRDAIASLQAALAADASAERGE